tara:strand:+ start:1076 stop:1450 length:375 start_codon:yes stop_codon:yes gene_type:complete
MSKAKRIKRSITKGRVYIRSSFNNTLITLTDMSGNVVAWSSSGNVGFKGSRKNTPYAAQLAANKVVKDGLDMGLGSIEVYISGPGQGKDSAVKVFQGSAIKVVGLKDTTPHPHNGCKLKKRRRM